MKNSGLESAQQAAKAVNCQYIVPKFSASQRGREYSDFSDLHRIAGLQAVKRQVQTGLMMARANVNEDKERLKLQNQSQQKQQLTKKDNLQNNMENNRQKEEIKNNKKRVR